LAEAGIGRRTGERCADDRGAAGSASPPKGREDVTGTDVIRVLQVPGTLEMGGTQTWLLQVLRHIDRERVKMDVLVPSGSTHHYDDLLRALGCRIIPLRSPRRFRTYAQDFRRIVREYGPYDILHSHIGPTSGLMALLGRWAGIPVRIVHSRNVREGQEEPLRRRLWRPIMCSLIRRCATHLLAVSEDAGVGLFGPACLSDPRFRVLTTGVELEPFRASVDRAQVRRELGIPPEATVVGHVGRFVQQKNHAFVVDMAVTGRRRPAAAWH
jgi:glycosyltransferase involved in cell wall biosynthesis